MNKPNSTMEIEKWQVAIQSEDWESALNAADSLAKIGGEEVLLFLIKLLDTKESRIRNAAALSLRKIKDNRAIAPLLQSIFKPENRDYNGTMVYALQTLDCKNKLVELFKILFYEAYESKIGAYTILEEQTFEFTRNDLLEIQRMWAAANDKPEKINGFDDAETKLMIKDAYEGFMEYLKEENEPIQKP